MFKMDRRLPEEIREKIFDYILRDDPATLFRLRCISKEWKICVDEYVSTFGEWFNACKQQIPKRCFNDIVEKIAPLSANSWQDSYWMRSRWSTVPKDVYHVWKNLTRPMLQDCKVTGFRFDSSTGLYNTFVIGDKYMVMSGTANNVVKTRIFDMQNTSTPIRVFDCFTVKVAFFIDDNKTCRILLQLSNNYDLYVADFLANNELLFSGLRVSARKSWIITANECFTVDNDNMVITHHTFASGCFHPREQMRLPAITAFGNIHNVYIRGDELLVLLVSFAVRGLAKVEMYRYKISGKSSGKLSFTKNEHNFFEEISCNLLPGISVTAACFTIANIVYINSASSIVFDPVMYRVVNCFNPRGILPWKDPRKVWNTPAQGISCASYHANHLALGTTKGSVWVYRIENIEDIVWSAEPSATSPEYRIFNLKGGRIFNICIRYVEGKLRVIARGGRSVWYIDFFTGVKYIA